LAPSENRSNKECGWKEGDRGGSAQTEETTGEEKEERKEEKRRKAEKDLTLTGLLMERVGAHVSTNFTALCICLGWQEVCRR
jgi:hypothetical protein